MTKPLMTPSQITAVRSDCSPEEQIAPCVYSSEAHLFAVNQRPECCVMRRIRNLELKDLGFLFKVYKSGPPFSHL